MAAGAAEPVVEVEVPERGIEVVPPHQADHAAAEPDAFGIAGRAVDGRLCLDELVGLALVVLGGVGGIGGGGFTLILGRLAALGEYRTRSDQKRSNQKRSNQNFAGSGEVTHNRLSWIKHPTHTFPDFYRVPDFSM